jgi:hypothetical protein
MTAPLGVNEFFVLEAGEYLDRLALLAAAPGTPAADELLRSARALRGSALMASQGPIARAAGGLEAVIRAVREGRKPWDATVSGACSAAVGELKTYLSRLSHWSDSDSAAAESLAQRLEGVAGVAGRGAPSPAAVPASDSGTRAFVAREGAAVASVLDQAGRILKAGPGAREALQAALSRTQPLRGLAALADYPPLAEILDAVELTAADVDRGDLDGVTASGVLDSAARAMSRAARDVIERGKPDLEAGETRQLGDLLATIRLAIPAIVPIDELLIVDGSPAVLQPGSAVPPGRAELVSRGERLRQVADDLERAAAPSQRAIRLHLIAQDLRAIATGIAGDLGHRMHHFGRQALEAISQGKTGHLGPQLRRAGELLQGYDESAPANRLIDRLRDLTAAVLAPAPPTGQMRAIVIPDAAPAQASMPAPAPTPRAPVAAAPTPEAVVARAPARDPDLDLPVVPIESLLYDEEIARTAPVPEQPIVPIESLAPDIVRPPLPAPVTAASVAQAPVAAPEPARTVEAPIAAVTAPSNETGDLVGSFHTYERLKRELGLGSASLEALLSGTAAPPAPTPAAHVERPAVAPVPPAPAQVERPAATMVSPVPATPPPAMAPVAPAVELEIMDITVLCYRGRGALERAAVVRDQIRVARQADADEHVVDPLIEELLDLVELALVDTA